MSMFNKSGVEFTHLVKVPRDPNGPPPTYKHKFPAMVGNKVVERWACKVRPIKDLTKMLNGCSLKRYKHYMVDFNGKDYEYWFLDGKHALVFALMTSGMTQSVSSANQSFDVLCPHCNQSFHTSEIKWC